MKILTAQADVAVEVKAAGEALQGAQTLHVVGFGGLEEGKASLGFHRVLGGLVGQTLRSRGIFLCLGCGGLSLLGGGLRLLRGGIGLLRGVDQLLELRLQLLHLLVLVRHLLLLGGDEVFQLLDFFTRGGGFRRHPFLFGSLRRRRQSK